MAALHHWFKSSRSQPEEPACVEVYLADHAVYVRDTKDRDGGTLAMSHESWHAFLSALTTYDR